MTALTKLFRTTTFRLSLTYLALFSVAAVVAIFYIYFNTTVLLTRPISAGFLIASVLVLVLLALPVLRRRREAVFRESEPAST